MANQDDTEFFEAIKNSLLQECLIFDSMLESEDLLDVIVGVKYIHALIKHKATFLLNEKAFGCLDLCFKFPWANILHNVIVNGIFLYFLLLHLLFISFSLISYRFCLSIRRRNSYQIILGCWLNEKNHFWFRYCLFSRHNFYYFTITHN